MQTNQTNISHTVQIKTLKNFLWRNRWSDRKCNSMVTKVAYKLTAEPVEFNRRVNTLRVQSYISANFFRLCNAWEAQSKSHVFVLSLWALFKRRSMDFCALIPHISVLLYQPNVLFTCWSRCKKKVKCTLAQALRLCTNRTAHMGSRSSALLFLDHGIEVARSQRHPPAILYSRERPGTHCTGGCVENRAGLDRYGKSRLPPGFDPRTFQPVANRYSDWATRPTFSVLYLH